MQRIKHCPVCRTDDVIPIIYGIPDSDLLKQYEEGTVYLGGPDDDDAVENWHCKRCDLNFK